MNIRLRNIRPGNIRLWPRSLAARTALLLLAGLALVQVAGLTIHALDRRDLQAEAMLRDLGLRMAGAYRAVVMSALAEREAVARELTEEPGFVVSLGAPPGDDLQPMPLLERRMLRGHIGVLPESVAPMQPGRGLRPGFPLGMRRPPAESLLFLGSVRERRMAVAARLADGTWLTVRAQVPAPRVWHSRTFLVAFLVMSVAAALLIIWGVRRLTAPVRTLAAAAETLGRDVNAPPLPETGPSELAVAARAFNTMAARIRRFVQDRTELLTAIGHDLRTPITRMKLRAEFIEDDEQRRKMLADLAELEAMVAATLAFGRDATTREPVGPIDLAELCRTVLDEAGDTKPDVAAKLAYEGPAHLTIRARSLAMKRALTNLVTNAVNYGGGARLRLSPARDGAVTLEVEDSGPGIPAGELERVFEPFHRLEASRSRETGGTGLGLPIARNILRAHGGDVSLANRAEGGLRATVVLPV